MLRRMSKRWNFDKIRAALHQSLQLVAKKLKIRVSSEPNSANGLWNSLHYAFGILKSEDLPTLIRAVLFAIAHLGARLIACAVNVICTILRRGWALTTRLRRWLRDEDIQVELCWVHLLVGVAMLLLLWPSLTIASLLLKRASVKWAPDPDDVIVKTIVYGAVTITFAVKRFVVIGVLHAINARSRRKDRALILQTGFHVLRKSVLLFGLTLPLVCLLIRCVSRIHSMGFIETWAFIYPLLLAVPIAICVLVLLLAGSFFGVGQSDGAVYGIASAVAAFVAVSLFYSGGLLWIALADGKVPPGTDLVLVNVVALGLALPLLGAEQTT